MNHINKTSTRISTTLTEATIHKLQTMADRENCSVSAMANQMIESALKRIEQQPNEPTKPKNEHLQITTLKKVIRFTALLNHFIGRHLTQQDINTLDEFCEEEFNNLVAFDD